MGGVVYDFRDAYIFWYFFFFQAEDGIRDSSVTGVQTCALPISRALEEWLHVLRGLGSDFRRQPKVAFGLRGVNIGIGKDPLSVLSGQSADVIGMEVRDQNDVDFFRSVACAAEVALPTPQSSPTPPH